MKPKGPTGKGNKKHMEKKKTMMTKAIKKSTKKKG